MRVSEIELGQEVNFDKYLEKQSEFDRNDRKWEERKLEETKTGIIAGKRTVQEGHMEEECGAMGRTRGVYWVADEYITVYLVACDMRGFYRVPAEFIEQKGDDESERES